ncbi:MULTISPECIES: substrate-binding domain-containing protein [Sphingobium]|uniref:Phosphate ABC transporter substrate-binding protein n=2 Tax=Sphingobium cupriresistens TaxID=1132417 RepID=A0A0J8ASQ7_9SPHN|nr:MULTISPECIES: substrate-binding domain-containing protein [Sphingobium]KMS57375.1 phosphate ABC transporter substrate-binding protein [Sphingobium cupriresistens LL01]MBJ7375365.1 substrate-binding domain-containing protein [Sphingobium sp.]MBJ7375460.1 substrate-binding domain-containing protein [Sphingobium sp.]RYM14889.1 phosphate ABC transporter substrate-binding protein [Sphingobium cupriresistens]WCP14389.1 Protein SphX [Sphingobium sp. AntQ-1]
MKTFALLAATTVSVLSLAACGDQSGGGAGQTRDQIRAVGSSTVYPFATAVAELFVQSNAGMKSPIIESTGTGGGMKLFCAGVGAQHPDIADASRRMKKAEFDMCAANGVKDIIEVQIGVDGLAFAESKQGPGLKLTPKIVYEALAANPYGKGPNKAQTWKDVDPSLPAIAISVFGPPSTSGTRDSLAELILEKGCQSDEAMKALKEKNEDEYKATCTRVREDGKYVDSGENDNLIVQKLGANPNAVGVFGFSFLEENKDSLKDVPINGVEATYETVSTGQYPGARPLYIYVKKAHMTAIPGLQGFLNAFAANWSPDGPLTKRGMVAAPEDVRKANAETVKTLTVLDGSQLK